MNLEARVEALEARLDLLERQATPTRQRAEFVKQSKEQAKREARLRRQKLKWVRRMIGRYGYVHCQIAHCQNIYFREADAMHALEGHHIRARSLGGGDEPENILYLCAGCHREAETDEAISSRRESQQGAAGKCEKLLKNRLSEEE